MAELALSWYIARVRVCLDDLSRYSDLGEKIN